MSKSSAKRTEARGSSMNKSEFYKTVSNIQQELKAPKNQFNSFGKYNYRSCEDILEAVKPLLLKAKLNLTISDEVLSVGNLTYVEATATVSDGENSVFVKAQAGIDPNRKGMDIAQSFGSSSSYARKYALNGLFLIDDTKDSDATNTHDRSVTAKSSGLPRLTENMPAFEKAKTYITNGGNIATIEQKYSVTDEIKKLLLA